VLDKLVLLNQNYDQKLQLGENQALEVVILSYAESHYSTKLDVELVGENASLKVRGVGLITGANQQNTQITVRHIAPNCTSDVVCKNVLVDAQSQSSWVGNVVIEQGANGTQTYEENRNLLLTRGAKANSEPNLEILEGDILSAGHASATGRFDDEQLFYLQSRGIPEAEAKKLVVSGFLLSTLGDVEVDAELLSKFTEYIDEVLEVK
jgi:Fe-S cluster assembly protein SufD